jgi:hypothetical protein
MREIEALRYRIKELETENVKNAYFGGKPYPEGLEEFPGVLRGQGFFPGGDGIWRDDPSDPPKYKFPNGGIMVLGNDFGCKDNPNPRSPGFIQCLARLDGFGFETPPTWNNIKEMLRKAGLPGDRCFFTNAFLGLRTCTKTNGPSPGAKVPKFVEICKRFFEFQLLTQEPELIIYLGHEPRKLACSIMLGMEHAWATDNSFHDLDSIHDPIMHGSCTGGSKPIFPLMVVINHPSDARRNHGNALKRLKPRQYQGHTGADAEIALLAEAWKQVKRNHES